MEAVQEDVSESALEQKEEEAFGLSGGDPDENRSFGEKRQPMLKARESSRIFGQVLLEMSKVASGSTLFGRQKEKDELVQCWERCRRQQHQEIVVISGSAGTGKSTLADSMRPIIKREKKPRCFYLSGKFAESNHHRKGPFEVFVSAFASFVNQLLDSGDQELISTCKAKVRAAVHKDRRILIQMIPAFEQILVQETDEVGRTSSRGLQTQLYGSEAANRLRHAFATAVAAICSCSPIFLFLDDIQWADTSSLDVLRSLLHSEQSMALLVVTSVRSQAQSVAVPADFHSCEFHSTPFATASTAFLERKRHFESTFREFEEEESVQITFIDLSNLELEHIQSLIANVLKKQPSQVLELSRIAQAQTHGNAFHLLQFLRLLVEQFIIVREGDQWVWDDSCLDSEVVSAYSVLDLLVRLIRCLPPQVLETLKTASCLGDELDTSALDIILQTPTAPLLHQASEEGLLMFSPQYGGYRFAHNWIRHAAFSLIPEDDVAAYHLKIGRRLWESSSPATLEENMMMIVSVVNVGALLITDQNERYLVAELNLRAGKQAMMIPSFPDAVRYFRQGLKFLGKNCWDEHYDLSLALFSNAAEIETANGSFGVVAPCINEVVQHGRSLDDKLQAYAALLASMEQQDDLREATKVCVDVLAQLGEKLPAEATKFTAAKEFLRVKLALGGKSDQAILNLPRMRDRRRIQTMRFLGIGFVLGWKTRSPISAIFAYRAVRLSLRHGMHETAAVAFAVYASTLCSLRRVKSGYRWGQLALTIAESANSPKVIATTNTVVGSTVPHWTRNVSENLEMIDYGSRVGLETGYAFMGVQSRLMHCIYCRDVGIKLTQVKKRLKNTQKLSRLYRLKSLDRGCALLVQMIHCYDGTAPDPARLTGTAIVSEESLAEWVESDEKVMILLFYYYAMEVAHLHGDLPYAEKMSQCCMEQLFRFPSATLVAGMMQFQNALISISLYRSGSQKQRNLKVANKRYNTVAKWAKNSPTNFLHIKLFLQAELLSLKKKKREQVASLYAEAYNHATTQSNLMLMSVIKEKFGDYLAEVGKRKEACVEWSRAADHFAEWGAVVKSQKLREKVDAQ